ncbi:hypothetical protein V8C35DRAFT_300619, partial [Trichoderma chlorosporum]
MGVLVLLICRICHTVEGLTKDVVTDQWKVKQPASAHDMFRNIQGSMTLSAAILPTPALATRQTGCQLTLAGRLYVANIILRHGTQLPLLILES